jgi:hypothetical protein
VAPEEEDDGAERVCEEKSDGRPLRLLVAVLAALTAFKCAFVARSVPLFFYPYTLPDSHDWIANGMAYAGHAVNNSLRPPGLPLLIAALDTTGLIHLLPALNQLILALLVLACFAFLARRFDPWSALIGGLLLFFNYFLQDLSYYIMADLYAALLFLLSLIRFIDAAEDPRRYLTSSVFYGLSALFSYAALAVLTPAYLLVLVLHRREHLRARSFWIATPVGTLIASSWFLYRWAVHGGPLQSEIAHIELLGPHLSGLPHYLLNLVSMPGIPLFILVALGLVLTLAVPKLFPPLRETQRTLLVVLGISALFWIFLYRWNDRRFLIYWILPLSFFATRMIHLLALQYHRVGAGGKALLWSMLALTVFYTQLGYPGPLSGDRLAISPVHFLVFDSGTDDHGGLTVDLSRAKLIRNTAPAGWISLANVVRRSRTPIKVWEREIHHDLVSFRSFLDRVRYFRPVSYWTEEPPTTTNVARIRYGNVLGRSLVWRGRTSSLSEGEFAIGRKPACRTGGCEIVIVGRRLLLCRVGRRGSAGDNDQIGPVHPHRGNDNHTGRPPLRAGEVKP